MANGYPRRPDIDFEIPKAVHEDLVTLAERARRNPEDVQARNLLQVASNALVALKKGHPGTHALEYMPSYPDLSDCRTMYVGADPNRKPSHRIVFRDVPPEAPGQRTRREVVALGERDRGRAYHVAGQRLGRPTGVRLADLAAAPEPIAERPFSPTYSSRLPEASGHDDRQPVD